MTQVFSTVTLVEVKCWCGLPFAAPQDLVEYVHRECDRAPNSKLLYCPLGHSLTYGQRAEIQKLKDEVARKQAFIDQQTARISTLYEDIAKKERSIRGYKGVVARTKRRVSKGMCPCCSQKFKDLKTHMASEHPDWNPDREADARAAKS